MLIVDVVMWISLLTISFHWWVGGWVGGWMDRMVKWDKNARLEKDTRKYEY